MADTKTNYYKRGDRKHSKEKKYVLPSIQKRICLEAKQIEMLFDSLLRVYPISTFLFWNVEKTGLMIFTSYSSFSITHEKNATHNPKASLANDEDVIAVLDGTAKKVDLRCRFSKKVEASLKEIVKNVKKVTDLVNGNCQCLPRTVRRCRTE